MKTILPPSCRPAPLLCALAAVGLFILLCYPSEAFGQDKIWLAFGSDASPPTRGSGHFSEDFHWGDFGAPTADDNILFHDGAFRSPFSDPSIEFGPPQQVIFGDLTRNFTGPGGELVEYTGQDVSVNHLAVFRGSYEFDLGGQTLNISNGIDIGASFSSDSPELAASFAQVESFVTRPTPAGASLTLSGSGRVVLESGDIDLLGGNDSPVELHLRDSSTIEVVNTDPTNNSFFINSVVSLSDNSQLVAERGIAIIGSDVDVSSGSSIAIVPNRDNPLDIGGVDVRDGSFKVSGESSTFDANGRVAANNGGITGRRGGDIEVSDGATLSSSGLVVRDGGSLTVSNASIVNDVGVNTVFFVQGSEVTLENNADVDSKQQLANSGVVTIKSGAVLRSLKSTSVSGSSGIIGLNEFGSVVVDGVGSRWTQDGLLSAGFSSDGTLEITNGGLVESKTGVVGRNAGTSGTVNISASNGSRTEWIIEDNLNVGGTLTNAGGIGSVQVSDQAAVLKVGEGLRVRAGSDVQVRNGGTVAVGYGSVAPPLDSVSRLMVNEGAVVTVDTGAVFEIGNTAPSITGGAATGILLGLDGELSGDGTIEGDVFNYGTISPGNSPGLLSITGDLTQFEQGVLDIEIASFNNGDFDFIDVGGAASIDGTVNFYFLDGFTPEIDDELTFLTAGAGVDLSLAQFNSFGLGDEFSLQLNRTGNSLSFLVVAVPEPSSTGVLAVSFALFALRRKREATC